MVKGSNYSRILLFSLVMVDLISGYIAFTMSLDLAVFIDSTEKISWFVKAELLWIIIFIFANLYDTRATLSRFEEILKIIPLVYFAIVTLIIAQVLNILKLPFDYRSMLIYGFIFSGFIIAGRIIIHSLQKLLLRNKIGLRKAVILGVNRRGIEVYENLQKGYQHGLSVQGFITAKDDPQTLIGMNIPDNILGSENSINSIISKFEVDDIIIALDKPSSGRIMESIMNVNGNPISIKILPDMYEVVSGLARTNQLVGVPLIDVNMNLDTYYTKHLKRIMDLIIAIPSLIIISPLWVLIALIIKLSSRGPVFYEQERIGMYGRKFKIKKFRSMVVDAENKTGPVWSGKNDQRITYFGNILRRFHLDETPQLINIIRGEMATVGPRPERPYFIERLEKKYPFYKRRLKIRPGVSGWAQIKQPYDEKYEDVHQKLKFDFYYIENLSFRLDIKIIINTIWVTIFGHGR